MDKPAPEAAASWLVTVALLPTEDPASRMRVLRTLESLGAAVMREGVYLLPDTRANRQALEALGQYIAKSAGVAHVLQVAAASPEQQRGFQRMFDRSTRYGELIKNVEALRVGFGHSDPSAIASVLHKQRRELETIVALDFFPNEMRTRAEKVLAETDAAVRKLMFPGHTQTGVGPGERLTQRTWVTRKPLWADRLACAWLIRRFVDPEGTVVWLDKSQPVQANALTYGFDGAHFANSESRVTYEEMLAQLGLGKNPALARIGSIVHFLEAGGTAVPEAAGVQTLLQGAVRRSQNEEQLLSEAEKTFDLLYEAYFEAPKARSA
ncbi:MAG TPA: chromate resistance protein ChrB domain-containing protein [Burkholderiales bacterium]|jgi:hypothetical protein